MGEPERLMRCIDGPNESSYSKARSSGDILAQEDKIMQPLEDGDCKDVVNVGDNIETEDEESELDRKPAGLSESLPDFVICSEVQWMIAAEIGKSTSQRKDPLLTRLVEDTIIEALQVAYEADKETVKTPLLNLVRNVIVETIQQEKMGSVLMRNIEALTLSDGLLAPLARRASGC